MTDVYSWSQTDGSNTSTAPAGAPEGMAPSAVNDVLRAIMGSVAREQAHINATLTSAGSADVQTLTYTVAPSAYFTGQKFAFIAGYTNATTTPTLNVNSLGAKTIVKHDGSALVVGDIVAGDVVNVSYDGTYFRLQSVTKKYIDNAVAAVTFGQETITAGENLADRDLIYQDIFNQRAGGATKWYKVDTDATGPVKISPRLGIALAAITSGNTGSAQVGPGPVTGLSGLTAGQAVYASTTAGALTQTEPATPTTGTQNATRHVGYALSTTSIQFDPAKETVFTAYNSSVASAGSITVEHFTDSGVPERETTAYMAVSAGAYLVSYTLGTWTGDLTSGGGIAALHDNNTNQANGAGAYNISGTSANVNIQWGTGSKSLNKVRVWRPNDSGYDGSAGGGTITVTVKGSSTGAWAGEEVTLGSTSATDYDGARGGSGAAAPTANYDFIEATSLTATAYAYTRITLGGAGGGLRCAEIQFFENISARNDPLDTASDFLSESSTEVVGVRFDDGAGANATTKTTFINRLGSTYAIAARVKL